MLIFLESMCEYSQYAHILTCKVKGKMNKIEQYLVFISYLFQYLRLDPVLGSNTRLSISNNSNNCYLQKSYFAENYF